MYRSWSEDGRNHVWLASGFAFIAQKHYDKALLYQRCDRAVPLGVG